MGIKGLLGQMPCTAISGFDHLEQLKDGANIADIDTGTLIYTCALINKETYMTGNYTAAVREFQRQIKILSRVQKWKVMCVFDGHPPPEKQYEHQRRKDKSDAIIITSEFIAMCAKVCKESFIPFIVAPAEADMQVCRQNNLAIAVCRDSDELGYGNPFVIIIDSYFKEEARVYDMTTPITEEVREKYPLYVYYHKYGIKIIHWWAAVMGCDISKEKCGIRDAGGKPFLSALASFDLEDAPALNSKSFADALRGKAKNQVRASYSIKQIQDELDRVSNWFTHGGTYYDKEGNILSVSGKLVKQSSNSTKRHMKCKLNPKTGLEFTTQQKKMLESIKPHNLLHNSAWKTEDVDGLCLPEGKTAVGQCTAAECKKIIIARGGTVTGNDGKALRVDQLRRIVRGYRNMEKCNPMHTVYFKRDKENNGVFANIDTGDRQSIGQILDNLASAAGYEQSQYNLFNDVRALFMAGEFIDDYDKIALEAPQLSETFIQNAFVHVGESKSQKNIQSGLKKVLEMEKVLYHSFAWAANRKSIFVLSKQVASQCRDERTRGRTAPGEKPKLAEYLVMAQIFVQSTTMESHGHTLGNCKYIMRSYCAACKAGCGLCYHRAGLCWMQYLHWGENRPTPKPSTAGFCSWVPGSRSARICSSLVPASNTQIEKLPGSEAEAKAKLDRNVQKNMHQGISARYDIYGGDEKKRALLKSAGFRSNVRMSPVFHALRRAQG